MKPDELNHDQTEKTKKRSVVDGVGYNVMYGFGEQYISPFAIRLGALPSEVAILNAVPAFFGYLAQIIGAKLTDSYRNRKRIVTSFVFLHALVLIPLFLVPFLTKNVILLTVLFALYLMIGNVATPAWTSWMGQVVREEDRTNYFAKRNRAVMFAMVISIVLAGVILNYFEKGNIWLGFGILFGIATLGRFVSWYFLSRQYEPRYEPPPREVSLWQFLKSINRTRFGKFIIFRTSISFAVMVASPFLAVYMLKDLQFSYVQFMLIIVLPLLLRALISPYWGKYSGKFGTRNIMYISAILVGILPLGWFVAGIFFEGSAAIFFVILAAELISGFGWAGLELTTFNYTLESSERRKVATFSAYFSLIFGIGVMLGGLFGSFLVKHLPALFGIKTILLIFLISGVLRLATVFIFMPHVKEMKVNRRINEGRLFLELVVVKPMTPALQSTFSALTFVEKGLHDVKEETEKMVDTATSFVGPYFYDVFSYLEDHAKKPFTNEWEKRVDKAKKKVFFYDLDEYVQKRKRKKL